MQLRSVVGGWTLPFLLQGISSAIALTETRFGCPPSLEHGMHVYEVVGHYPHCRFLQPTYSEEASRFEFQRVYMDCRNIAQFGSVRTLSV